MQLKADLPAPAAAPGPWSLYSRYDSAMGEALLRLLRLLDTPEDIVGLAPLAEQEICIGC